MYDSGGFPCCGIWREADGRCERPGKAGEAWLWEGREAFWTPGTLATWFVDGAVVKR